MLTKRKLIWVIVGLVLITICVLLVNNKSNDEPKLPKVYTESKEIPVYLGHYFNKELGMLSREQHAGMDIIRLLDMKKAITIHKGERLCIDLNVRMKSNQRFEVIEIKRDGDNYGEEKLLQTSYAPKISLNLSKKKGIYKIIIRTYKGEVYTDFGVLLNIKE